MDPSEEGMAMRQRVLGAEHVDRATPQTTDLDRAFQSWITRFDLCGVSIGGLIALWLAIAAPERVTSLVASSTAARVGTAQGWQERIAAVSWVGLEGILPDVVPRWFSSSFPEREPETLLAVQDTFGAVDPIGYVGCCAALRDADLTGAISEISCPTLVMVGDEDQSTPLADSEFLHENTAGSRLQVIPGAALLPSLDRPDAFNAAVLGAWDKW